MGKENAIRLNGRMTQIVVAAGMVLVGGFWKGPAIADGIPGVTLGTETGAPPPATTSPAAAPATPTATPSIQDAGVVYTRAMVIGYAAVEQEDYQTALINFRRALAERPGDKYALAAISNVESYIQQQRQEAARLQRLQLLQNRLEQSVTAMDWACATNTVDEMITLVPPDSLERSRLVTYRGELSSLLDARADINQWSTVCPG